MSECSSRLSVNTCELFAWVSQRKVCGGTELVMTVLLRFQRHSTTGIDNISFFNSKSTGSFTFFDSASGSVAYSPTQINSSKEGCTCRNTFSQILRCIFCVRFSTCGQTMLSTSETMEVKAVLIIAFVKNR